MSRIFDDYFESLESQPQSSPFALDEPFEGDPLDPAYLAAIEAGGMPQEPVNPADVIEATGDLLATAIDPEATQAEVEQIFESSRLPGAAYKPAPRLRVDPFSLPRALDPFRESMDAPPFEGEGTTIDTAKQFVSKQLEAMSRRRLGAPREKELKKLQEQEEGSYQGAIHPGLLILNELRDPVNLAEGRVVEGTGAYMFRQILGLGAGFQQSIADALTYTTVENPETGEYERKYADDIGIFQRREDPEIQRAIQDTGSALLNTAEAWQKMQTSTDIFFQMPDLTDNVHRYGIHGLAFAADFVTPVSGWYRIAKAGGKAVYKGMNAAAAASLEYLGKADLADIVRSFADPYSGIVDAAAFANVSRNLGYTDDFADFTRADVSLAQRSAQNLAGRAADPALSAPTVDNLMQNPATQYLGVKLRGAETTFDNAAALAKAGQPLRSNSYDIVSSLARHASQAPAGAQAAQVLKAVDDVARNVDGAYLKLEEAASAYLKSMDETAEQAFRRFFYTDTLRPALARQIADLTGGNAWRFANESTLVKADAYDRVMPVVEDDVAAVLANSILPNGNYKMANPGEIVKRLTEEVGASRLASSPLYQRLTQRLANDVEIDAQDLFNLREVMISHSIRTNPAVRRFGMQPDTLSSQAFVAASTAPERRLSFVPGTQGHEQFVKAVLPAVRMFGIGKAPLAAEPLPVARDMNVKFQRWLDNYNARIGDTERVYREHLTMMTSQGYAKDPADAVRILVQNGLSDGVEEYVRLMDAVYAGGYHRSLKAPTEAAVTQLGLVDKVNNGTFQLEDIVDLADATLKFVSKDEAATLMKARNTILGAIPGVTAAISESSRFSMAANAYAMSKIQKNAQRVAVQELLDLAPELTFSVGAQTGRKMFERIVGTLFDNPQLIANMNQRNFAVDLASTFYKEGQVALAEKAAKLKMRDLQRQRREFLNTLSQRNKELANNVRDKRAAARLLEQARKRAARGKETATRQAILQDQIDVLQKILRKKTEDTEQAKQLADLQREKVKDLLKEQTDLAEAEFTAATKMAEERLGEIKEVLPSAAAQQRLADEAEADAASINTAFESFVETLEAAGIYTGTRRIKAEVEGKASTLRQAGKEYVDMGETIRTSALRSLDEIQAEYMKARRANNDLYATEKAAEKVAYDERALVRQAKLSEITLNISKSEDAAEIRKLQEQQIRLLTEQSDDGLEYNAFLYELDRLNRNTNQGLYRQSQVSKTKIKDNSERAYQQLVVGNLEKARAIHKSAMEGMADVTATGFTSLKAESTHLRSLIKGAKQRATASKQMAKQQARQFNKAIREERKESIAAAAAQAKGGRAAALDKSRRMKEAAAATRKAEIQQAKADYEQTMSPLDARLAYVREEARRFRESSKITDLPSVTMAELNKFAEDLLNKALGRDYNDVMAFLGWNQIIPRADSLRADLRPAVFKLADEIQAGTESVVVVGSKEMQEGVQKFLDADYLSALQKELSKVVLVSGEEATTPMHRFFYNFSAFTDTLRRIRIGGTLGGPTAVMPNFDFFGMNASGAPFIKQLTIGGGVGTMIRAQAAGLVSIFPKNLNMRGVRQMLDQPLSDTLMDISRFVPGASYSPRTTRTVAGAMVGGYLGGVPGAMLGGATGALYSNWARDGAKIGKLQLSPAELRKLADQEDLGSFMQIEFESHFLRDAAKFTGLDRFLKPMGGAERLLKNMFSFLDGSKNYWAYCTQTYDEVFRKSVFIEALTQGRPMHEARELARNVLLDYSSMPEVLRQYIFKGSVYSSFFYGIAKELLTAPIRGGGEGFSNIVRLLRMQEAFREPGREELVYPEYAAGRLGKFFTQTYGGKAISVLGPAAPPLEMLALFGRVQDMAYTGDSVGLIAEGAMRTTGFAAQFATQTYTDALLYRDEFIQAGYVPANYIVALNAMDTVTGEPVGKQWLEFLGCEPVTLQTQVGRAEEPTYAGTSWKFRNPAARRQFLLISEALATVGLERFALNSSAFVSRVFGDQEALGKQSLTPAGLGFLKLVNVTEATTVDEIDFRTNYQIKREINQVRQKSRIE